jgi:hypothetical protein
MSRQPIAGAGAAVRAPSEHAACAPAPSPSYEPSPSSPLTPPRYRALRARSNALLVTLYERSSLTLREIALLAGRTNRAVGMQVRALGCVPRNAKTCRPGTDLGPRRRGPRPSPLNAAATERVAAAFAAVARELSASAEARLDSEFERATARAERRVARARLRMLAGTARSVRHLAGALEDTAAMRRAHAAAEKRSAAPAKPSGSRPDFSLAQDQTRRNMESQMHQAHAAARRAKAEVAAAQPAPVPDAQRRINEVAERYETQVGPGPRIRGL